MKLRAEWANDCQGKKDYDADLVELSTRYWPSGGGFHVFDRDRTELGFQGNDLRPGIRPSACASILIGQGVMILAERTFEADTEDEVKAAVEQWAQEQYDRVVRALAAEFGVPEEEGDEE